VSRRSLPILLLLLAFGAPARAGGVDTLVSIGRSLLRPRATPKHSAELREALDLKALYGDRHRLLGTGLPLTEVEDRVEGLAAHILSRPLFAVDAKKGARALQTAGEVKLHARFLDRELADFLPAKTYRQVHEIVELALKRVKDKALFARPGLHGLSDLVEDELIAGSIAHTPALTAKLAVAVEALRGAANTQSLHAVRPGEALPLEVEFALRKDPGLLPLVERARADGVSVFFRRTERTPQDALEAINRIAVLTQETYVSSWLEPLLRAGTRPRLTVSKNGLQRAHGAGLVSEQAGEAEIAAQLEKDVEAIRGAGRRMMGFVLSEEGARPAGLDARLEAALDDLRVDHALSRMRFDHVDDRSQEAKAIFQKMAWVGPLAHGLEHLHLGAAAKMFAGSADDILGEWGQYKLLRGRGFSRKELWKRMRGLVPVFVAAGGASRLVEHLLDSGQPGAAGALFGLSAVALSLTSAIQSMAMYKHAYDILLKEGKIDGKIGPLAGDPRFQATLKMLDQAHSLLRPEGRATLLAEVRRHLDGLGDTISAEDKAGLLGALEHLDLDEIEAQVRAPSTFKRWKAAVAEDFSNPTQLGVLLGSGMAPLVGAIAGKAGVMHNGFAMAAIGSTESLVGLLSMSAARTINDWKMKRAVERKLDALLLATSAGLE
jgi:hypothetical protein